MREGISRQSKTSKNGQAPPQDFQPADRDGQAQADYGGSVQHRDEDTSAAQAPGEPVDPVATPSAADDGDRDVNAEGPDTQHTGP